MTPWRCCARWMHGVLTCGALALAPPLVAQRPGTVTDLTVIGATDSALTLRWTEVASGATGPATYSVRIGPAAGFAWWLLPDGPQVPGSGATPVTQAIRLTIGKLVPSTPYSVQLVAYTGVLGAATFGGLSNVATAATMATPPNPPPPPPATGGLTITVATAGASPDTDGYTLTVQGVTRAVASTSTTTITGLTPAALGANSVLLAGVAPNCTVTGTNPRPVVIVANATGGVGFTVTCLAVAPPGLANQLLVWPPAPKLTIGLGPVGITLVAFYRDSTGAIVPGVHAAWRSSDTTVAPVDSFGRVSPQRAGLATITGAYRGLTATSAVDVAAAAQVLVPVDVAGLVKRLTGTVAGGITQLWTGFYEVWPTDSTGKRTARVQVWVSPAASGP